MKTRFELLDAPDVKLICRDRIGGGDVLFGGTEEEIKKMNELSSRAIKKGIHMGRLTAAVITTDAVWITNEKNPVNYHAVYRLLSKEGKK